MYINIYICFVWGQTTGPDVDKDPASVIVPGRGVNENKCELLQRTNMANDGDAEKTWPY